MKAIRPTDDMIKTWMRQHGLPAPHQEYRFCYPRRFRFDWCWPEHLLALECEGGVWTRGRHTRGSGFLRDMEKYNLAATLGWRLLRTTPLQLCTAETLEFIRKALAVAA